MTDHATAPQPGPEPHDQATAVTPVTPADDANPWAAITIDDPQPDAGQAPAPFAPPEPTQSPQEQAARRARRRRAAVRWSCAVLVFAIAGTGTALAVTAPERTDIPGLATANDGRYTFPPLTLPPLPSGKAAPDLKDNSKGLHQADLRYLLLPAPKEAGGSVNPPVFPSPTAPTATASAPASASAAPSDTAPASPGASASATAAPAASAAPGATAPANWVGCEAMGSELQNPARLHGLLLQNVCRAATVREWTASDGTSTRIRLLRFGSPNEARETYFRGRTDLQLKAAPDAKMASGDGWDTVAGIEVTRKDSQETAGKGVPTTRVAFVSASDVVAVVTMTNPRGVPATAFRQVVTLQCDLLA
ncbi:hypothetical protein AB0F92_38375 [Kitasatospora aureofaciens]|uniref:hypothetical protein n=1 Tax=Kitasatospora aureofaciens TaxID=1894 RepID=UPI00340A15FA